MNVNELEKMIDSSVTPPPNIGAASEDANLSFMYVSPFARADVELFHFLEAIFPRGEKKRAPPEERQCSLVASTYKSTKNAVS